MNKEQAENILDAYVLLSTTNEKAASDSLREVILDVMTTTYYPPMTLPIRPTMPTVEPYKPLITWTSDVETGEMEVRDD